MASALPILLLGGAAVMLMAGGKKKKKKARIVEGYVPKAPPPAVKTKGPPATTASKALWKERQKALKYLAEVGVCACDPGTPDGLYGKNTKSAIRAFQTFAKLEPDGKWGPKTENAMTLVLSELASIAEGEKAPAPTTSSKLPSIGPREVGFAPDYSRYEVGNTWTIAVLDKYLESKRRQGELLTIDTGDSFADWVVHNPSTWIAEQLGAREEVGYAIYGTLWVMASGGLLTVFAAPVAGPVATAILDTMWGAGFTFTAYMVAEFASSFPLWANNEDVAASALEIYHKFISAYNIKVGNKWVRIKDLPANSEAVIDFNKYILNYIYAFQKRHFEG